MKYLVTHKEIMEQRTHRMLRWLRFWCWGLLGRYMGNGNILESLVLAESFLLPF